MERTEGGEDDFRSIWVVEFDLIYQSSRVIELLDGKHTPPSAFSSKIPLRRLCETNWTALDTPQCCTRQNLPNRHVGRIECPEPCSRLGWFRYVFSASDCQLISHSRCGTAPWMQDS